MATVSLNIVDEEDEEDEEERERGGRDPLLNIWYGNGSPSATIVYIVVSGSDSTSGLSTAIV